MCIRYSIELADHKAYQAIVRSALPGFVAIRWVQAFGGAGSLLFFVWLFTSSEYGLWPTFLGMGPAIVLGCFLWWKSPGLWRKANLDAMYGEGKLDGHLGEHILEIRDDGLLERNAAGEHLSHWNQFETIYSTSEYTFFLTKNHLAYILPKGAVVEGSYPEFVEFARTRWRSADG